MDKEKFLTAKAILDENEEINAVIQYLGRFNPKEHDPVDYLTHLLNDQCDLVATQAKQDLCIHLISKAQWYLNARIRLNEGAFANL